LDQKNYPKVQSNTQPKQVHDASHARRQVFMPKDPFILALACLTCWCV